MMLIESTILHTAPHLKEKNFTIEGKKIINSDGVHHEIDIYVNIGSAPGYSAAYIFECKNRKDPISKNDIITFIEKINCSDAAHGYFVGTAFTKDAIAQAAKCARLTLLHAIGETNLDATGFQVTFRSFRGVEIMLTGRSSEPAEKIERLDINTVIAESDGVSIVLLDKLRILANAAADQHWKTCAFKELGEHERVCGAGKRFPNPGSLVVNGRDIRLVMIKFKYSVTLTQPVIKWDFDIEKRGRVLTLGTVSPEGNEFVASLFFTSPQQTADGIDHS